MKSQRGSRFRRKVDVEPMTKRGPLLQTSPSNCPRFFLPMYLISGEVGIARMYKSAYTFLLRPYEYVWD